MANRDKGRRRWGGFSQDSMNSKLEKDRLAGMRGGGNRASQALYRPGSGPLRKSSRPGSTADEYDNEVGSQDKSRSTSVQYRLRQSQSNRLSQPKDSPPLSQIDDITEKLDSTHIHHRNSSNNEQTPNAGHNINSGPGGSDPKRKNKKPELELYVPKKVKEALAEQDATNRSPIHTHNTWERERDDNDDRDSHSNRSYKSDRNRAGGNNSRDVDGERVREDNSKRYSGNRRHRHANENEERWRSDSPVSVKNYANRRDNLREVRQGSEPLSVSNQMNDFNRTRDTRSVEPVGHSDKFQGKPPSGKRNSAKDGLSKNIKLDTLPPRFQKKYLADNGYAVPTSSPGTSTEDSWNGSSITFQQASSNYMPVMQHSQTMQNLPLSGSLPQSNRANTVPARSRGRGRLRPEELDATIGNVFRPVTPEQYSAPSSRSHTPSQEYVNRSYDRRGSNSTYTSMESLSRADSAMMSRPPPSSTSPATSQSNSNRGYKSPESYRRGGATSPIDSQHRNACNTQRVTGNAYEHNSSLDKQNSQITSLSSKGESFNPSSNTASDSAAFDWCEEVELNEKLEAEYLSRSSSILSIRESTSMPRSQTGGESHRRRKKKKKDKHHAAERGSSKGRGNSHERQKNQQNRENDSYNNNQKNTNNNNNSRRNDQRRQRNIIQRSRESSKDRNYRSGYRNFDDLHRHRTDRYLDEDWRTGRKISTCDSDDGRQTPKVSSNTVPLSNSNSTTHRSSPPTYSNAQPGVLILPDVTQSSPKQTAGGSQQVPGQQQQRTLFDPNNPHKPIVITSPGSRAAVQRDNDIHISNVPVFQSNVGVSTSHYSFQGAQFDGTPAPYMNDQFGNMRPSWYEPYSVSFHSAKNHCLLLDIERADLELQWILSSGGFTLRWERVSYIRHFLQQSLKILLETDIKFCQAENVEQHFWKILFYNLIEMLRKALPKESPEGREHYKKIMLNIIDDGTIYLESLLSTLETTYKFKLDTFLASSSLPKGLGLLGLALVSAQKIFLFLGDLARYKEQANETSNYGKSRQWYLKAQQINPKNGRPYSQLALLAHYARRKLDAVYYYMRSLMSSNPFHSARESLIALFDENRKKYLHYYESIERKRREERESKERARMKEKEGANIIGGGLRRETWIHPGDGRRVRRTTSAATANEGRLSHSDLEELTQLTSVEVNKRFVTSYLHVHGKLITKIGMETFQEAGVQMLKEFRALLQHSPLPLPGTRLLQLLALNMFAIETTQLKDAQMEQGYRSEVQERALVVSLQMFSLILERGVSLLMAQLDSGKEPRLVVGEDLQVLLPAIKIWCDWMLCHSTVWNPPPSCTDYRVGPPGDAWSRLATMVNLLEKLNYSRTTLIQGKEAEGREEELELVKLPEDITLAGFTPLMLNPQDPCYVEKTEDMEVAQVCLRISKILFFGQVFLCGLETPVLKLQKSETGVSEYVSVVEASSTSSPSSPPEQSDSELLVESYSEEEEEVEEKSISKLRRLPSCNVLDDTTAPVAAVEIRSLIERKEELERRQRKQDRHRQRVQAILQNSSVSVEIEVRPRQLVPDTNCFIDYLSQLQIIARATSGAQPIYTLMVPLVVLNELEGLARGADARDCPPASRAALNPEHVARVAESAKVALAFARSRNPAIRCLTTRGTVLTSSTFTVEEDVDKDGLTRNDDRILTTCLSLCRTTNKDQANAEEGQPRRLRREVVLLTEDRNLRVKALSRDVPVREVPDFMQWAGLG